MKNIQYLRPPGGLGGPPAGMNKLIVCYLYILSGNFIIELKVWINPALNIENAKDKVFGII